MTSGPGDGGDRPGGDGDGHAGGSSSGHSDGHSEGELLNSNTPAEGVDDGDARVVFVDFSRGQHPAASSTLSSSVSPAAAGAEVSTGGHAGDNSEHTAGVAARENTATTDDGVVADGGVPRGPAGDAVSRVAATELTAPPTRQQIKRWQRYLANERAEAAVYRELAKTKTGEEKEILLAIAAAETRHENYWIQRLGNDVGMPRRPGFSTVVLAWLARRFGSVFTLALMQSAETRSPYDADMDATGQMAADERIHAEVVRGLAARGREQLSGNFRAALFGLNDGLVSNLALLLGVAGATDSSTMLVLAGVSGMLSGALSMGAGEYVSVTSHNELLASSEPDPETSDRVADLDVNANELELVYRARGMDQQAARDKAAAVFASIASGRASTAAADFTPAAPVGLASGWSAAMSSFMFFAAGALIPCIPFFFGLAAGTAAILACVLVGVALLITGAGVGLLSGVSPLRKALIQLAVGLGAAAVTFGLGRALGVAIG